jgi:hypothetical protein
MAMIGSILTGVTLVLGGLICLGAAPASAAASLSPGEGSGSTWCASYGGSDATNNGNPVSYDNVYACTTNNLKAEVTPFDTVGGFQCEELAARFVWNRYDLNVKTLNAVDFASVVHTADVSVPLYSNGTVNEPYLPGDIVSFNGIPGTSNATTGHVAVVIASSENSSGNGAVTVMQQDAGLAMQTFVVSNWSLQTAGSGITPRNFDAFATATSPSNPSAPTSVSASGDLLDYVTVSWTPSSGGVGGIAGYDVYRNSQLLATTSATTTSYVDSSLIHGTDLSYQVSAFDAAGNQSLLSSPASVYALEAEQATFALASQYGSTYCRRVGNPGSLATEQLECTTFNGTKWTDSISQGEDWGYDVGWSWVAQGGNPAYCRRVGNPGSLATEQLECTTFNGTKWTDSISQGEDWGYDVGWSWV